MPYASNADLPDAVRTAYSASCQTVFRRAFNAQFDRGDEASAFRVAHTAARNCEDAKSVEGTMETKQFMPSDITLTDDGEVVVAFAKLNVVDHDDDITLPGAIPTKRVPMSAFNHTSWPQRGGMPPIGVGQIAERDDMGVFTGKFFTDTTHGRDAYLTVKAMADLQEWSYGFNIISSERNPKLANGLKARRALKELDIFEVSPVLMGAGIHTATLAIKSDDDALPAGVPLAEELDGLLARLEAFGDRAADIVGLRVKEGRAISTARRQRIAAFRDALRDHGRSIARIQAEIDELLTETDPHPEPDDRKARAMSLRARIAHARATSPSMTAGSRP